MQSSIDEAARRCTERQNWNGHWTHENQEWRVVLRPVLNKFEQIIGLTENFFPPRTPFGQIGSHIFENDKFFEPRRETFAGMNSSIRWQPVLEQYSAEKKKPRGGSRGAYDTQVFPAVSPGRNGVGGRIYSSRICVSTPLARYTRPVG